MKNPKFSLYIKLLVAFLLVSTAVKAQEPLYILTDKIYNREFIDGNLVNDGLKIKVNELLRELNLSNVFTPFVTDKKDVQPGDNFIKMYSSYNYLTANQKESIIPKFIVHKRNWQTPYYFSYFIGRKQTSRFNSFNDFASIKRIYLQRNSMSGYYSPLYKFWEMGFIKNPSARSLKEELHKDVIIYSTPDSVINAVSKDDYSIGATGEEVFGNLNVEIKLVNMVLPQDVICISQHLTPYEEKMNTLILKLFSDTVLINRLHLLVTKVTPFSQTNLNSYNFNENMIKIVDSTKVTYSKEVYISKIIPLNDRINFSDLVVFIGKSSISVYLWILGILLSVYTLGYNTGNTFLPFLAKLKDQLKNLFTFKTKA